MISVQHWTRLMNKGSSSFPNLLLENYKHLHLDEQEMMLIIHIHSFLSEGIHFPSIDELHARMSCSKMELTQTLNKLHKNNFIAIHSSFDDHEMITETYSLDPLWEKLFRYLTIEVENAPVVPTDGSVWANESSSSSLQAEEGQVFQRFEEEFGRPLSPMECETISMWLDEDNMSTDIIFMALREAVISNKLSLKYIDRILLEWKKKGYTTLAEVENHTQKFRQQQLAKMKPTIAKGERVNFSFYNWLEKP